MLRKDRIRLRGFTRDLSISTQLTLVLASLVLLITLVLTGVLDLLFTQREKDEIGQQFARLAVQATDMLDRSLFERYREVQILSSQPGLGSPDAPDDKRRLLEAMQKTYSYYAWLGLTDTRGRVLVSANRVLEGVDVSKRPWFTRALQGIHLTDVHEAALLDKLLRTGYGSAASEPLRFIDVAFPYRDPQGRIAGVFGTHLSMAWATDIENSVMLPLLKRSGAEMLVLDKDMTVIIGPKHLMGTRLALPAPTRAGARAYAVETFGDGRRYLVGYSRAQGYGTSPGLGWTVMVRQDLDLAYAPVAHLRRQVMLAGGGITLLFAALAWLLARRIARPLGAIAESARRIEADEAMHIDVAAGGYREIGVLHRALQSLIGKLQANEASLRQADRRKDEFLATLAHELRNPLAPISAAADLLRMGRADGAQQQRLGSMIARQTHHMTGLIDDLLDVARVTRGQVKFESEAVDLRDVVAEAMEQAAPLVAAKGHRVETRLSSGPALVMGDRKRLVQVLANLLGNAAKYTPGGGRIDLALTVQDGRALVSVRDNGIGMSADLVDHVFELFTQETRKTDLSTGGLGVGLALAKRLVEHHGGTLTASSAGQDLGSEFVVTLPAMAPVHDAARIEADAAQQARAGKPCGVLIVDDNVDAADTLALLVQSLGYDTCVDYLAQEAIDRARSNPPRICLLDIGMPVMDGYALVRHLRQLPDMADAFMIAVTGYGGSGDRERALAAGFDEHMVKPIDLDCLAARLAQAGFKQPLADADPVAH